MKHGLKLRVAGPLQIHCTMYFVYSTTYLTFNIEKYNNRCMTRNTSNKQKHIQKCLSVFLTSYR